MKRFRLSIVGCAFAVGLLLAISTASADVPTPESASTETGASKATEVEVNGSGWVVEADGTVTYKESSESAPTYTPEAEASAPNPSTDNPSTDADATTPKEVEVTGSGWQVAADGTVTYSDSEQPAAENSTDPEQPQAELAALCSANYICVFTGTNYSYLQGEITCSFAGNVSLSVAGHSALNRCGNKTNYLRRNVNVLACMNPGGNRPYPGAYNEVYVLTQYGAYC